MKLKPKFPASSFDKVYAKLKKTTKRVNRTSTDGERNEESRDQESRDANDPELEAEMAMTTAQDAAPRRSERELQLLRVFAERAKGPRNAQNPKMEQRDDDQEHEEQVVAVMASLEKLKICEKKDRSGGDRSVVHRTKGNISVVTSPHKTRAERVPSPVKRALSSLKKPAIDCNEAMRHEKKLPSEEPAQVRIKWAPSSPSTTQPVNNVLKSQEVLSSRASFSSKKVKSPPPSRPKKNSSDLLEAGIARLEVQRSKSDEKVKSPPPSRPKKNSSDLLEAGIARLEVQRSKSDEKEKAQCSAPSAQAPHPRPKKNSSDLLEAGIARLEVQRTKSDEKSQCCEAPSAKVKRAQSKVDARSELKARVEAKHREREAAKTTASLAQTTSEEKVFGETVVIQVEKDPTKSQTMEGRRGDDVSTGAQQRKIREDNHSNDEAVMSTNEIQLQVNSAPQSVNTPTSDTSDPHQEANTQKPKPLIKSPPPKAPVPSKPLRSTSLNDIIWRAYATTKSFTRVIAGITVAQAAVRRWIAMKEYERLKEEKVAGEVAAVEIAAFWRMCRCRCVYKKTIRDVITCQSIARRHSAKKTAAALRHERRIAAAKLIDATTRGFVVRMRFLRIKSRITAMQALVRGWRDARRYGEWREAATLIAAVWKGCYGQMLFKRTVKDIIVCQSVIRRCIAACVVKQLRYERDTAATTLIQSKWRAVHETKCFAQIRSSVIVLQSMLRGFLATEQYNEAKRASTKVAASWRRYHDLTSYKLNVRCIIVCQSAARRKSARTEVKLLRHKYHMTCAKSIQARWRACAGSRRFVAIKAKVILIQSSLRRWKAEKYLREHRRAVAVISACWRRFHCMNEFKRIVKDVIVCQSFSRLIVATAKANRLRHERRMASATVIQTRWRAAIAARHFAQIQCQVTLVQAVARRWLAMKHLRECKKAATYITSWLKCCHQRMVYKRVIKGMIMLQSMVRCHLAKKRVEVLRHMASALLIQTRWRSCTATKHFTRMKENTILIQTVIHRWSAKRRHRHIIKDIILHQSVMMSNVYNHAATKITSQWRGFRCLKDYCQFIRGVIMCQCAARRILASKKKDFLWQERRATSAILIQSRLRAHVASMRYMDMKYKVTVIQSIGRRLLAERYLGRMIVDITLHQSLKQSNSNKQAATKISSRWRGCYCLALFKQIKRGAIAFQSIIRQNIEARKFGQVISKVVLLQSIIRQRSALGYLEKSRSAATKISSILRMYACLTAFRGTLKATTSIQARWRTCIAKGQFTYVKCQVTLIQSRVRQWSAKKYLSKCKDAATKISSQWRRCYCVMTYKHTLKATTSIQARWRACIAKDQFAYVKHQVTLLQSSVRRHGAEKYLKHCKNATTKISSQWRRLYLVMKYKHTLKAVTLIQTRWRACIATDRYTQAKFQVTLLQSSVRRWRAVKYLKHSKDTATKISCQWRRFYCVLAYRHALEVATMIQARWRACIAKDQFAHAKCQVTVIQSSVRRHGAEKYLKHCKNATTKVSSQWRRFYSLMAYKYARRCVTSIQARWRACIAKDLFVHVKCQVTLLQSSVRRWRAEDHLIRCKRAVTKIGSQWRRLYCVMAYQQTMRVIILCQSSIRRYAAAKKRWMLWKELRETSAKVIQTRWQSFSARKHFRHVKRQVTILQSKIRRWAAEKYLREHISRATTITAQWRCYHHRTVYKTIIEDVIVCQSFMRHLLATQKVNRLMHQHRMALATVIQAKWRTAIAAERFTQLKCKLTLLQAVVRRWLAMTDLEECKRAVTIITASWRRFHQQALYKRIIRDVILCQSVVRRNSATYHVELLRHERRVASSTAIQSRWRAFNATKQFSQISSQITLLQSVTRRWSAQRHLHQQEAASTKVTTCWRRYHNQTVYKRIIYDVIKSQSFVRSTLAVRELNRLRHNHRIAYATIIQARWRAHASTLHFALIVRHVIRLQAVYRKWAAEMYFIRCKMAATKIISKLRCLQCQNEYKRTISDVIICQSVFRQMLAMKTAERLWHERRVASATVVQAQWRAFAAAKYFTKTMSDIVRLQSIARRWKGEQNLHQHKKAATKIASHFRRFQRSIAFIRIMRDIIICQSIARRNSARERVRMLAAAKFIETQWVTFLSEMDLVQISSHVVFIKDIPGAWLALREKASTMISKHWRRCRCSVVYKMIQKDVIAVQTLVRSNAAQRRVAIMRWERDMTAATIIQANWRAFAGSNSFHAIKSSIILVQSVVRRKRAVDWKSAMVSKLRKAATYHAADFFDYSKKRKSGAVKVQSNYRKYAARKHFNTMFLEYLKKRQLASTKIQSTYRTYKRRAMYLEILHIRDSSAIKVQTTYRKYTAMKDFAALFPAYSLKRNLASIKIQCAYRMYFVKAVYKIYKENEPHTSDYKKSYTCSKIRRSSAIKIQASFRGYFARSCYVDMLSLRGTLSKDLEQNPTSYPANLFFRNSKERRAAAVKIQTAYRKHLFRTTCYFRQLSFDEHPPETDIVCVGSEVEASTGNQGLFSGEKIMATFKAMIAGEFDAEVLNLLPGY